MNERISHSTSKIENNYVVSFDNKEFNIKVIDCQQHHKDYPEVQKIEVTQEPTQEDMNKCIRLFHELRGSE